MEPAAPMQVSAPNRVVVVLRGDRPGDQDADEALDENIGGNAEQYAVHVRPGKT
jgi:hypothetical protein